MATICGICHEQPPKYKCPSCQLPYCSLACSKRHKADGHGSEVPVAESKQPQVSEAKPLESVAPPSPEERYKALADSPEFKALVVRYPGLKERLRSIHDATLEPSLSNLAPPDSMQQSRVGNYRGGSRGHYNGRQGGPWTQRKGDEAAMRAFRRARESAGEPADEGVREFLKLVQAKLGQPEQDAALQPDLDKP